jgi:hypothetical protein
MRQIIAQLRALLMHLEAAIPPAAGDELQPGDVVQLRPDTDVVFGGMMLRVTRVTKWSIEGYLLSPHRCGSKEAWHRYTPGQVTRIGRTLYQEADWGFGRGWPWKETALKNGMRYAPTSEKAG